MDTSEAPPGGSTAEPEPQADTHPPPGEALLVNDAITLIDAGLEPAVRSLWLLRQMGIASELLETMLERYGLTHADIDAFGDQVAEQERDLSPAEQMSARARMFGLREVPQSKSTRHVFTNLGAWIKRVAHARAPRRQPRRSRTRVTRGSPAGSPSGSADELPHDVAAARAAP